MIVKYTGYTDSIIYWSDLKKRHYTFQRNQWVTVPDELGEILLKDSHFISKDDFICKLPDYLTPIKLGVFRWGALGDLIMLVPVVRFIKREYNHKIILITQACHVDFVKRFKDAFDEVYSNEVFHRDRYDKLVVLDGVPECDHSMTNHERLKHRTKLYEDFFGLTVDKYDFSIPIEQSDMEYVEGLLNASL